MWGLGMGLTCRELHLLDERGDERLGLEQRPGDAMLGCCSTCDRASPTFQLLQRWRHWINWCYGTRGRGLACTTVLVGVHYCVDMLRMRDSNRLFSHRLTFRRRSKEGWLRCAESQNQFPKLGSACQKAGVHARSCSSSAERSVSVLVDQFNVFAYKLTGLKMLSLLGDISENATLLLHSRSVGSYSRLRWQSSMC